LKNILTQFSEEIDQMSIELKEQIPSGVWIRGNPELIEILIRNLITNSIKHNIKKGNLEITLTSTYLSIVNKGLTPKKNPEVFFERFSKENNASSSLGLGLAIVKQICGLSGFLCTYTYENSLHKLIIQFGSE
jgi:signal transduction histidine kinase